MSNATDAMSVEKRDGACVANIPNLLDYIEKLEATIAKHERREDSHMKQIEELISAKGIRDLEAVAEAASKHLRKDNENSAAALDYALKEAGYFRGVFMEKDIKKAVKAEREACAKLVESKCEYQRPALVIHSSPEFRLYADTCKELATAIRKRGNE